MKSLPNIVTVSVIDERKLLHQERDLKPRPSWQTTRCNARSFPAKTLVLTLYYFITLDGKSQCCVGRGDKLFSLVIEFRLGTFHVTT